MERFLLPDGAGVMKGMIGSCANILECERTIADLAAVTAPVPLRQVGERPDGTWRSAFKRLDGFAAANNLESLGAFEVAWYFGSAKHVEIMQRSGGYRRFGDSLGFAKGLVSHVLLPLNEALEYQNLGCTVRFENLVDPQPSAQGVPCYHLGYVIRIPLSAEQVQQIKADQASSGEFVEALKRIKDPIKTPEAEYQAAKMQEGLD